MSSVKIQQQEKVRLASLAGYCYGVKRAVELCLEVKKQHPDKFVCVLGQLIHNNQAIEFLEQCGVKTVKTPSDVPTGSVCIIRSHGESPHTLTKLISKGVQIVDATCPDVKRVQETAVTLAKEGYQVVIIGQSDHPEVLAIQEHVNSTKNQRAVVISDIQDVINIHSQKGFKLKLGVVVQTTQTKEKIANVIAKLVSFSYEVRAFNTICNATSNRQKQAKEIAAKVEFMIIIGGKQSANTTHLAEICKEINQNTVHVENVEELKAFNLSTYSTIGVTAGASTPKFVIDQIIEYLSKIKENEVSD